MTVGEGLHSENLLVTLQKTAALVATSNRGPSGIAASILGQLAFLSEAVSSCIPKDITSISLLDFVSNTCTTFAL